MGFGVMGYGTSVRRGIWQHFRKSSTGPPGRISSAQFTLATFDLSEIAQFLLNALRRSLRHKDLALLLRDPEDEVFRVEAWIGYGGVDFSLVKFAQDSPLIRHFSAHPIPTQRGQLEMTPWLRALPGREREALVRLGDVLLVPLSTDSSLVGLLVVGQKASKPTYGRWHGLPAADCSQIATIIEEVRLHHRLKKAQDRAVPTPRGSSQTGQPRPLEQTARGIAHDLNNVLATILSNAELLEGEVPDPEFETGILDEQATKTPELATQDESKATHRSHPPGSAGCRRVGA